jgi:SAM-dependent methyltransferase
MMFYKREDIFKNKWKIKSNFEFERQILHHKISYITCNNNLFLSSVKNYDLIINLGSGYGIWSIDFSKEINCGAIIDIDNKEYDIYEILEKEDNSSYSYEQGVNIIFRNIDLKKDPICFKDNTIDFIYQRDMLSVYNIEEWHNITKEIYRVLKKSGYFELIEYNPAIKHINNKNSKYSKIINNYLIEGLKKNGYLHDPFLLEEIIESHFDKNDIIIKKEILPLYYNSKFKDYCINVLILSYRHFENEIEKYIDYSFDVFIEQIKKEWDNNKSYIELYIITAQK